MAQNPAPIKPRVTDARAYDVALRRAYLRPFVERIQRRLANATGTTDVWRALDTELEALLATPRAGVPIELIQAQIERVDGYHRAKLIQTFRSALGVDVRMFLTRPAVAAFMAERISENVDLVKTIPPRFHAGLKQRVGEEFAQAPFDQQRLRAMLRDEYQSSGYNLRRLTRDQTNKQVGGLSKLRHNQLGITRFIWRSVQDQRVRAECRQDNGNTYEWSKGSPIDGATPGTRVQDRCTAEPSLGPADLDRLGAQARVTTPREQQGTKSAVKRDFESYKTARERTAKLRDKAKADPESEKAWFRLEAAREKEAKAREKVMRSFERAKKSQFTPRAVKDAAPRFREGMIAEGDGVTRITHLSDPKRWKEGIDKALNETVNPTLVKRMPRMVAIGTKSGIRSDAAWKGGAPLIRMNPDRAQAIVAHELGHIVEYANPSLFRSAVRFLSDRADKKGYLGSRDGALEVRFTTPHARDMGPSWYPRKFYEKGVDSPNKIAAQLDKYGLQEVEATEVVSSAVEYMHEPHTFIASAPEFWWWTVDNIVLPGK